MSESAKKGKLVTKIFFSDNAEWMYLLNFYKKYIPSKLEIQCKNGMFFSWFWLVFCAVHLDIVHQKQGVVGEWGGCLTNKICQAWRKLFVNMTVPNTCIAEPNLEVHQSSACKFWEHREKEKFSFPVPTRGKDQTRNINKPVTSLA